MKRIISLLLSVLVIFSLIPAASAYNLSADCSIEILVKYDGKNINGGKLKAVKVGYLDTSENVFRRITYDKKITGIGTQRAVNAMVDYYNDNKDYLIPITVKVSHGKALFDDLSVGLYLIFQKDAAPGYNNLSPFLVTVPYTDDDGKLHYNVTVRSKTELFREPKKEPPKPPKKPIGNKLPQTGQLTWPVPVLAASGMILFSLGWWLCFGRRKDSYEK